ncbi:MAG: light-harvesting protein [bacterium]|jgi:light-harvesting protein B-800-850 alpha chain|nr:light-harvesting protein [Betaproteobacteria bacterium]
MIYGKIWLVVKPSVGVPLFLGAVAVGSFAVHAALLTNTTWVKAFLNGDAKAMVAEGSAAGAPTAPAAKK